MLRVRRIHRRYGFSLKDMASIILFPSCRFKTINLETGVAIGGVMFLSGLGLLGFAVNEWRLADFGNLDYAHTMRIVIPGMTMAAIGFQTIFSSFFLGILRMKRK